MSKPVSIKDLEDGKLKNKPVHIFGWVKTFRSNRFISLNDGSTINDIQCVVDLNSIKIDTNQITTGTSIEIYGKLVESLGREQKFEIIIDKLHLLGSSNPDNYPIQPKKHSFEFLRENAHLRIRTRTISSVMRIRSEISYAIHKFFNENGFFYIHTPIITGSDAEGAGEMFSVSSLDKTKIPLNTDGSIDFSKDFFGKETHLTVSGQLEAELAALGLGQVYTFGPTFRAENSNTSRHLAEFWMIEPEVAFNDLFDNMDLTEDFLKYICNYILENCAEDLNFLDQRYTQEQNQKPQNERSHLGLIESIKFVTNNPFKRLTYTEAIDVLLNSKAYKKKRFEFPVEWGVDLQSEHERYLVEKEFKCPVILRDYPGDIKAFYMRQNDDGKTVAAMDVLFPGVGEIVGGSQREERLDILQAKCKEFDIPEEEIWWYLETRKFGTVPHAGFGMGFERLVMFLTGMSNIRDVIPFPRARDNAEF